MVTRYLLGQNDIKERKKKKKVKFSRECIYTSINELFYIYLFYQTSIIIK